MNDPNREDVSKALDQTRERLVCISGRLRDHYDDLLAQAEQMILRSANVHRWIETDHLYVATGIIELVSLRLDGIEASQRPAVLDA